jgi:hypothetical protein
MQDTIVLKEPQKKRRLTLQQLVVATHVLLGITAQQELLLKLYEHQAHRMS